MDKENRKLSSNIEASGRFHTNWLNMMYPRLKLARNILYHSGFLCVSVGDEELCGLRLMLNDIFGEENHRNTITLRRHDKNLSRQFMAQGLRSLAVGFEYVLVYSKSDRCRDESGFSGGSQESKGKRLLEGFLERSR